MRKGKDGFYCRFVKRALDIVLALLVMLLFCWLFGILALLVRTKLGSPVLFRQKRPGRGGELFTLCKFRTMTDACDADGRPLPDELRLTRFGRFLRSTSMDELPEMWNILTGDMSLVGPRPLLVQYLPYYTEEERHRHDVRPGLTGLAQVNGRNSITWEQKFAYDLDYVRNVSFGTDLAIVCKTVRKVFVREGIGQAEEAPEDMNVLRGGARV